MTRQAICYVHSKLQLKKSYERMPSGAARDFISRMIKPKRQWKVAIQASADCSISGEVSKLLNVSDYEKIILDFTKEEDLSGLRKVLRVQYRNERYCSKEYSRLKKRICYFALTTKGQIISIDYFVYNQK